MLRSLDLFTGIGGMVRAFEGISTPVAYCEIEFSRVRVLAARMISGEIPVARIHTDVRTMKAADFSNGIDIIVASWPCKGFATCGPKNAFDNPHSALFHEFARLALEIRPPFLFQENVPGVCGSALDDICGILGNEYDFWWTVLPAYAVGAPHLRKRWFCLGVRKDVDEFDLRIDPAPKHSWDVEPCPRMSLEKTRDATIRMSMLGNAVVPECARTAFLALFGGLEKPWDSIATSSILKLQRPTPRGPLPSSQFPPTNRYTGCCVDGVVSSVVGPDVPPRPDLGLTLKHDALGETSTRAADRDVVVRDVPLRAWATPRGGAQGSTRVLTKRSITDLGTQLRFEAGTPESTRRGKPDPEFVEWMMGFPPGWTSI